MWNILTLNYCTICGFQRQMSHQWGLKPDECKSKKYNIMNSNKTQMKNPSNISVIPIYRGSVLTIFSLRRFKNVGE